VVRLGTIPGTGSFAVDLPIPPDLAGPLQIIVQEIALTANQAGNVSRTALVSIP
jgi:hypothetical protein